MKKLLRYSTILIFLYSCNQDSFESGYPCDYCYSIKPEIGKLNIKLTINDENTKVPLIVYKGEIDNHDTIWVDSSYVENYELYVPVDEYYSVTAEYLKGNKTVFAVDGDRVFLQENASDCDTTCWIIFDGNVDVKLRDF